MSNRIQQQVNEIARAASLQNKKVTASAFVARRWQNVRHASHAARANKKVIILAIQQEGKALQFANQKLRSDYDIVLCAIRNNGLALEFASEDLRNNQSIVLEACEQNGNALQFASESMKQDRKVITVALEQNMLSLVHVPMDVIENDDSLIQSIVSQSVRSSWHGTPSKAEYGEPDFNTFTSMDYLEHYADQVFDQQKQTRRVVQPSSPPKNTSSVDK